MYKQPFNIALVLGGISFAVLLATGIIYHIEWYVLIPASLLFGVLIFWISHRLINRFIFNNIKVLFDKVLKVNFENSLLDPTGDPFASLDDRIEKYIIAKKKADEEQQNHQNFRKEYIGNIAHELKTPIFNIQGYVLTLLDGGLEDERINRDYLQRASNSVDRIINIIEDLDLITRLDSGEVPLNIKPFDFVVLLKELHSSIELLARENEITLFIKTDYKKPIVVEGDKDKLFQVLMNLSVNGIKYGKPGGKLHVNINEIHNKYLVEVTDDGLGISEENLPRVFERFYRADKSRGRKMGGSGLGLSIVKHIIEAHQQTITVSSKINEGSTFAFTVKKA